MIPAEAYPRPDNLVDRRTFAVQRNHHGERDIKKITGICLHQTACQMGERDTRYDTCVAHLAVTRSGRAFYLHDCRQLVWHGNGWNSGTIGIEIDGLYEGVQGDPSTVWNDPSTKIREVGQRATPEAIETTKQVVRWFCSEIYQLGGEIKVLVAHRQSSMDRRDDPGSELWQSIALPLHDELGLTDGGIGFKLGGYAIPESWDPRCKGIKY